MQQNKGLNCIYGINPKGGYENEFRDKSYFMHNNGFRADGRNRHRVQGHGNKVI